MIDQLVVEESLEDEDSKDWSEPDSSRDSEDSESESDTTEVVFYGWETVDKKITKSRIELNFKDVIEMLKEEVAILEEHIYITRRQVNAYQEMKASLSPNDLMIQVDFQWVVCKKLFMKLKVSTINAMRICTCGVTGWGLNLDHVLYFKFWLVPIYLISLLCGCTTNVIMGKAQWVVSEKR